MTLADIASGETDAADVWFLVTIIIAVLGVILAVSQRAIVLALIAAAVAAQAVGLLLL